LPRSVASLEYILRYVDSSKVTKPVTSLCVLLLSSGYTGQFLVAPGFGSCLCGAGRSVKGRWLEVFCLYPDLLFLVIGHASDLFRYKVSDLLRVKRWMRPMLLNDRRMLKLLNRHVLLVLRCAKIQLASQGHQDVASSRKSWVVNERLRTLSGSSLECSKVKAAMSAATALAFSASTESAGNSESSSMVSLIASRRGFLGLVTSLLLPELAVLDDATTFAKFRLDWGCSVDVEAEEMSATWWYSFWERRALSRLKSRIKIQASGYRDVCIEVMLVKGTLTETTQIRHCTLRWTTSLSIDGSGAGDPTSIRPRLFKRVVARCRAGQTASEDFGKACSWVDSGVKTLRRLPVLGLPRTVRLWWDSKERLYSSSESWGSEVCRSVDHLEERLLEHLAYSQRYRYCFCGSQAWMEAQSPSR
ncbi:hypothetical protein KCV06_g472, partial [Aureobasidium melanogenum]